MAQELTNAAKNLMLDALDAAALYVSAHTGSPGLTGANEVSGGTYARVRCEYNTAASGSMSITSTETINIPAATTVSYLGLWNISTGGTSANFMAQVDITDEEFGSAGTLDVTALTIALDQDPA